MAEISNRPYLLRAMFDWIVDNDWTPHVQIDANYPGISVPQDYAQDGMLVLNVHPDAVRELSLANDWFYFKARFQGIEREIGFTPDSVLAIFARENGQGMPFPPVPYPDTASESASSSLKSVDGGKEPTTEQKDKPESEAKRAKKRSHLSVVK